MSKFPFPTSDNLEDALAETKKTVAPEPSEDALDSGIEESFPASDPVSVTTTKIISSQEPAVETVETVEVISERLKKENKAATNRKEIKKK